MTKVRINNRTYYNLHDFPTREELRALGFKDDKHHRRYYIKNNIFWVMASRTGKKRPPKKGEWYISGATPEAYRAPNDLTDSFYIVELRVITERVQTKYADVTKEFYTGR